MVTLTVKKTLYVGTDENDYLKYEIVSDGTDQGIIATAYREVALGEVKLWQRLENVDLSHLGWQKKTGFQAQASNEPRVPKDVHTATEACERHWQLWHASAH
ncbi:hypothetical protein [Acerihabitans arboris]|uniref:Uncharacterized protein n=1 Tax=Acerihabitans arboris TaxID=2691583 RepID=A0A845SNK4_9GAMM|nr:hypothetical protein [Acerihabitans arboris]NDL64118.1 hypothetical protein [Acerihabitans arboris]